MTWRRLPGSLRREAACDSSREPNVTSPLREVLMREVRALECQRLGQIDALLEEVERLSCELRADPGHHVRRSSVELRLAFASRGAVEPAVIECAAA